MKYRVELVDRLPAKAESGTVYVSREYQIAVLECACGCGHRITLLLDDGHRVEDVGGLANVWPSIGVWDAPCRSHFWIRNGRVQWASTFSEATIRTAMERQVARHRGLASTEIPWHKKVTRWLRWKFLRRH